MAVTKICAANELIEAGKKVISVEGVEIGIFHLQGEFYAWHNRCPHQGGPVCQGRMFHLVEEVVDESRCSHGRRFNTEKMNIVCPWHGTEFDIKTGRSTGAQRWTLRPVKVFVEDGQVVVDV